MGRTGKSIIVALALCVALLTATEPGQTKGHANKEARREGRPGVSGSGQTQSHSRHGELAVSVGANGRVTSTKVLGGNPVLAEAATNVVRKWRFEPSPEETDEIIEIVFDPDN